MARRISIPCLFALLHLPTVCFPLCLFSPRTVGVPGRGCPRRPLRTPTSTPPSLQRPCRATVIESIPPRGGDYFWNSKRTNPLLLGIKGSDAPSYHSADYRTEPTPAYTPRNAAAVGSDSRQSPNSSSLVQQFEPQLPQQQTIGLPPLPPLATGSMNMNSYRLPTWSTRNAPAARQYNSVVERRVNAERERSRGNAVPGRPRAATLDRSPAEEGASRPLEDPYLVGEQAAAQARRERLLRENGDDILIREDQQWDWLLGTKQSCSFPL